MAHIKFYAYDFQDRIVQRGVCGEPPQTALGPSALPGNSLHRAAYAGSYRPATALAGSVSFTGSFNIPKTGCG